MQQFTFSVLPNDKFLLFPSLFGMLATKAMAFCEISPLAPFLCSKLHLMYCQTGNFYYFSFCLTCWLSKPWHFVKFHYFPTKTCHFLNVAKWLDNLITPSNCLHFSKYKLGILGVKYTVFVQNAL